MANVLRPPRPSRGDSEKLQRNLTNKASMGNRVYNGVSPSPTVGKLNPKGFNERDARAKTKRELLMKQISKGRGA